MSDVNKFKNKFWRVYGAMPDPEKLNRLIREHGEKQVVYVLGRLAKEGKRTQLDPHTHLGRVCTAMAESYKRIAGHNPQPGAGKGGKKWRADYGGSTPLARPSGSVRSVRTRGTKTYTRRRGT